jgi:RNA polymerase sigma factor (sigma-70 family)
MDAGDVYRAHARGVLGYLRSQGVSDPEDVLGEVFLHVSKSLPRFQGDEEHLRRWVFTLAHHRIIDDRRRRARRPQIADAEVPDRAAPAAAEPADPELMTALAQLTDDQREVVLLRFIADMPIDEVARMTNRSSVAVRALQHRAMAQLARNLTSRRGDERAAEPGS